MIGYWLKSRHGSVAVTVDASVSERMLGWAEERWVMPDKTARHGDGSCTMAWYERDVEELEALVEHLHEDVGDDRYCMEAIGEFNSDVAWAGNGVPMFDAVYGLFVVFLMLPDCMEIVEGVGE